MGTTYLVDLGQIVDFVDGVALLVHSICNSEQAHIRGLGQGLVKVFRGNISLETLPTRVDLTDSLLQTFLKSATDGHDFTDRFHGRADFTVDMGGELGKIPLGNFGHDVIQRGFETCGGGFGDSVGEFRKGVTEGDLGSSISERVAGGFGCQSG